MENEKEDEEKDNEAEEDLGDDDDDTDDKTLLWSNDMSNTITFDDLNFLNKSIGTGIFGDIVLV